MKRMSGKAAAGEGEIMSYQRIGAVLLALAITATTPAAAQQVRAGLLTCDVSAGLGLIVTAQKQLSCDSRRVDPALCMRTMAARYSRTLTVPPRSTLT